MDWFTWLSQTQLDPALVYDYGVLFACNELTLNDVAYFDHELLFTVGVRIAKHRLEILKLARADNRKLNPFAKISKSISEAARRCFDRWARKLGRREKEPLELSFGRKLSPLKLEWKEVEEERGVERLEPLDFAEFKGLKSPRVMADSGQRKAMSGPIVTRKNMMMASGIYLGQQKNVSRPINEGRPVRTQSPRLSGPLGGRVSFSRSPRSSGQLDESHSPWAMLFDDLKPT